jgi:hypothetical protein
VTQQSYLQNRLETLDGSTPHASVLSDKAGAQLTLAAFEILKGGDVFDSSGASAPAIAKEQAERWTKSHLKWKLHGASSQLRELVVRDILQQIGFNPGLVARLEAAKPIQIELIPPDEEMARAGLPPQISPGITGLYWDRPRWPCARIILRQEQLGVDPVLVVHEMAHAIHYLAFTANERALIYQLLQATFGSRQAMDEVFAIYSEREFVDEFSIEEKAVRGVYGFTRRQWSENHVFTRFVRKLYFPHKPLAGPKLFSAARPSSGLKLPPP